MLPAIEQLRKAQLSNSTQSDWQQEQLNFVPLRGSWHAQAEHDFDLEEEIKHFFKGEEKVLLLLGDSGAGKSLYTQGLINKLWQSYQPNLPIPLWISLPALKNPVNRAIEETLEHQGLTVEQIAELKQTQSFLIILDAYDEIRQHKNIYVTNHLEQWRAKIIMTCRHEYLYTLDDYRSLFMPFESNKGQHLLLKEMHVRPFNQKQIHIYIEQYLKHQQTEWKEVERYQQAIEDIPGLKKLIATPFMLRLAVEAMPQMVERYQSTKETHQRKQLTQAALYDVFIEHWFIRQEQKLKSGKQIKEDEDIKPEFWEYAKTLAQAMHAQGMTQVVYELESSLTFDEEVTENSWEAFFNPQKPRTRLLQTACLVREVSPHQYAFIHASLLEYFLTRNLYETLHEKVSSQQKEKPKTATRLTSQDYFNERLLVKEINTIQFLADRVVMDESESIKQSYFDRIYVSRNNPEQCIAAANAITILNRAEINFCGMDFNNIQIPEANLSGAIMDSVQLQRANLAGVNLQSAWLREANLTGANMSGVHFGELSFIKEEAKVKCCCYSPNGRWLAIGTGNNIWLYDAKTRKRVRQFIGHNEWVTSIAFDPLGERLASGSWDYTVRLWEIASGKELRQFTGHSEWVSSVTFDPRGERLASGSHDYTVRLWEIASGKELRKLTGHTGRVICIAFDPRGERLVSGSWDQTVRLWEIASGKVLRQFIGHASYVMSIVFDPRGEYLASGSEDKTVRLWEVASGKEIRLFIGHIDSVNSIAFDPRGERLASGSKDKTVRLWEIISGKELRQFTGHISDIISIAFDSRGEYLASGSDDQTVRLWEIASSKELHQFTGHIGDVSSIAFDSRGERLASGSHDNTVRLWEIASGMELRQFTGHERFVKSIAFDPRGERLASGDGYGGTVRLWEVASGKKLRQFFCYKGDVRSIAFDPSGERLASGEYSASERYHFTVRLWDIANEKELQQFKGHGSNINCFAFAPRGERLASGSDDHTVRLWDISSGKELHLFIVQSDVKSIAFDPRGEYLASGSRDNMVRLWDTVNGKLLRQFTGHSEMVNSIAFDPHGERLASGSDDHTVRLWEVAAGHCLKILTLPHKVYAISWIKTTYGEALVTGAGREIYYFQCSLQQGKTAQFILRWLAAPAARLWLHGANISQVSGLDQNNYDLFKQYNVQDEPLLLEKQEIPIEEEKTQAELLTLNNPKSKQEVSILPPLSASLLTTYARIQDSISKGLKKKKWQALDPANIPDTKPKTTAISNLKREMNFIRDDIEAGRITNVQAMKDRIRPHLNVIINTSEDKQKHTFWGKRKVTQSSLAKRLKAVIHQIDKEPDIHTFKK